MIILETRFLALRKKTKNSDSKKRTGAWLRKKSYFDNPRATAVEKKLNIELRQ